MTRRGFCRSLWLAVVLLLVISQLSVSAFATGESFEPIAGVSVKIDKNGTLSNADGVLSASVTSGSWASKTTEITVTNNTGTKVYLTFTYTPNNPSSLTIDGANAAIDANSTCTKTVANGGKITVKLTAAKGGKTATLTMQGFGVEEVPPTTSAITIEGSGTVSVDGVDKANGSNATVLTRGSVFKATPASGYTFLAWVNASNSKILSMNAEETFSFDADTPVKAIFVNNTVPYFRVGTEAVFAEAVFSDLQAAIDYVGTAKKTIVLACNGTLTGSYTIPTNATLLIPFNSADQLYETKPTAAESYTKPSAYRTLTMANGSSLTVKGALSVSAQQSAKMGNNGAPTGPAGFIRMNEGSSISVESGGKLYAWGFITGSSKASVVVKNGGKVYENFQITDWRGGSAGSTMVVDQTMLDLLKRFADSVSDDAVVNPGAFPISQYYVQNIEVPLTLEYGAVEGASTAIDAPIAGVQTPAVDFIGSASDKNFDGMFRLESGSLTKWYDGATDRLHISVDGTLNVSDMFMNVATIYGIIKINLDSTKYTLPVNSNITIHIPSGSKLVVKQDVCLLPGVEIIIDKGGVLEVAEGYDLTAYDADQWLAYTFNHGGKWVPVRYAPGKTYDRKESDLKDVRIVVNGTLEASKGAVYVTAGGADICSTGNGKANLKIGATTKIYQATQSGTAVTYVEMPIQAPKLKQETGEYFTVSAAAEYNYDHHSCTHGDAATDGLWVSGKHTITTTTNPATCEAAGTKTETCSCGHVDQKPIAKLEHEDTNSDHICDNGCGKRLTECDFTGDWVSTEAGHARKCSICGVPDTNVVAHNPKAAVQEDFVDSTCYAEGSYNEVVYCNDCNYKISSTPKTVTKKEHTPKAAAREDVVDATCEKEGSYNEVVRCAVAECNAIIESNPKTIDQKSHDYSGEWVYAEAGHAQKCVNGCGGANPEVTAHTFATDWTTDGSNHWKVCQTAECKVVSEKAAHNGGTATCVAQANCEACGIAYGDVDAEQHVGGTEAFGAVEGTCVVEGYTAGTKCASCKAELTQPVNTGKVSNNHKNTENKPQQDPTCTEVGYTAGVYCNDCKNWASGHEEISAVAHNYAVKSDIVVAPATCNSVAVYRAACSVCGDTNTDKTIAGTASDPNNHADKQTVEAQAPTCTEVGWNAYEYCTKCDYTTYAEIPAIGHDWNEGNITLNPTCTEKGTKLFTCQHDAKHTKVEDIDPLQHNYVAAVTEPTCTDDGYTTYTCSRCNDTYVADEVAATGHTEAEAVVENEVAATCTADGSYDTVVYCSVCGAELSRNTTPVPALGHKYVEEVIAPDFGKQGYTEHTCSVCDHTYKDNYVDALVALAQIKKADGSIVKYETFDGALEAAQEGDTIVLLDDAVSSRGFYPIELPTNGTLDLNGKTFTGTAAGKVVMHGGTLNTYADDGETIIPMAGPANAMYLTTDAVFVLGADWSMTVESGTATLGASWQTLPNQKVTIGKDAVVSIPEGMTFTIRGEVIVEGTLICNGTIELGYENASLTIADEDLDVTLAEGLGDCVLYENGKYVIHTHTPGETVVENEVGATCTAEGSYDNVVYCTVCNKELSRNTVTVEKIAHTPAEAVEENRTESTCTVAGSYNSVVYCSVCNTELSRESKALELAAHTEGAVVVENEKAATCTAEGSYDNVVYCTVCNAELSRNTVTVDKIAHAYDAVVTAPTCTAKGYTTYTCSACGDSYVADETDMVAHTPAAAVKENEKASTCTAAGSYDSVVYCSVCGEELSRDTVTVDKIAHTPAAAVEENRVESTCTVAGSYEEVVYCSVCGAEVSRETKALELAAHTEGAVVVENEKAATCTAEGSYDNVVYCTVCNAELSRNTVTVDKIAHAYDAVVTAPTCTAKGYTTYTCSACGDSYVADEVAALGHTPAEAVKENEKASTCTVAGSYDEVVYCSVCGAEVRRETKALELAAHTEGAVVVENEKAATCTAEGSYDNVVYCTVCNAELSRNTVTVDKIAHDYDAVVTAPTCTAKGYTTYTCSACGDSYVADETEMVAHTPGAAADCENAQTCTVCGTVLSAALGHDWDAGQVENKIDPTCTEDGTHNWVIRCQHDRTHIYSSETVTTPALGHKFGEIVEASEATCVTEGNKAYKQCTVCELYFAPDAKENATDGEDDASVFAITELAEHKLTHVDEIPATCLENGTGAHWKCETCDGLFADEKGETSVEAKDLVIEAKGEHTVSAVVKENMIINQTSTGTEGTYDAVKYCTVCGAEVERKNQPLKLSETPFKGTSMALENSLALCVIVQVKDWSSGNYNATLTRTYTDNISGGEGVTAPSTIALTDEDFVWADKNSGYFLIYYSDISAKEMCDVVTVNLYKNGEFYASYTDSAMRYGMRMVNKYTKAGSENPKNAAMYVDMLNYGAAAQLAFKYNYQETSRLANAEMTAAQQAYATTYVADADVVDVQSKGVGYKGTSLGLNDTISMYFVIKQTDTKTADHVVISYTDRTGAEKTHKIQKENLLLAGGSWYLDVPGLTIVDGQMKVTCTVYDSENNVLSVSSDSMESYAARMRKGDVQWDLYDMILRFSRSAYVCLRS